MGGKVFSTGPKAILTPRMLPEFYDAALKQVTEALKPLFPTLRSPLEAPGKASFGDVDILVSLEGANFSQEELDDPYKHDVWVAVHMALGATRNTGEKNVYNSKSFAMSWPPMGDNRELLDRQLDILQEEANERAAREAKEKAAKPVIKGPRPNQINMACNDKPQEEKEPEDKSWWFVQVDVQLCETNHQLEWRAFKHDHGDMWNILGTVIRPYGLTANEEGLYIRIPEMEKKDKKKARVFLTDTPTEVLQFLIINESDEWTKRFPSVQAMYAYVARCKAYQPWLAHEGEKLKEKEGHDALIKDSLKSNDRQRMRTRHMFAEWINEYVPSQIAIAASRSDEVSQKPATVDEVRDKVRVAAFSAFPNAEASYRKQLAEWNQEEARIYVKNTLIKRDLALPDSLVSVLPNPQEGSSVAELEKNWRGSLRSALSKIIVDGSTDFVDKDGVIVPPTLRDADGVFVLDDVKEWISENHERVGRAAWAEQCARSAEKWKLKEEQRLALEKEEDLKKERDAMLRYD